MTGRTHKFGIDRGTLRQLRKELVRQRPRNLIINGIEFSEDYSANWKSERRIVGAYEFSVDALGYFGTPNGNWIWNQTNGTDVDIIVLQETFRQIEERYSDVK